MSIESVLENIEASALGAWMRDTLPAMQVIEATHVLAAVVVLGTVLIVDLRLLGLADSSRGLARISRETLPLTWIAFAIAVVTGSLMFTTSAEVYFANTAFRLKALTLLAAGLNMALFQLVTARHVADTGTPPRSARIAGLLSVLLWAAVVLLGRWIGFTKGYDFTIPLDVDLTIVGARM
jgi:hypothetical protein